MKRLMTLLFVCIPVALYSFDTQAYGTLHRFSGNVAKMTITIDDDNSETVYFDEEGMKIFSDFKYKSTRGYHVSEIAAFDKTGVRVEYFAYGDSQNKFVKTHQDYKHNDAGLGLPMSGFSWKYYDLDEHSNWTCCDDGLGGHKITRQITYYDNPAVAEDIEWAKQQRSIMFKQEKIYSSEMTAGGAILMILAPILGLVSVIPTILLFVFGVCSWVAYDKLRNFFNNKAGEDILPSKLKYRKRDLIAAIFGGVCGLMLWSGALFGVGSTSLVTIVGVVWMIVYFRRLYKSCKEVVSPRAAKWYIIYCVMSVLLLAVVGVFLSVFAIGIAVMSLMGKGLSTVWDQEMSHTLPTEDGIKSTRHCSSCSSYSNGYCSYHNRAMPPDGGCGAI